VFNNKPRTVQFLRFCAVGSGNTAVDFATFYLLTLGGAPALFAQVLSYSAGVANSYWLNRKWTFRVARKANALEVAKFILVNGVSLLISSGLLFILRDMSHLDLWLSKLAATGGGMVVNFMGSRLWVFIEDQNTRSELS
jgi:putative flippase GtrA